MALTPSQLDKLPEPVIQLMSELQDEIISDICRRIKKTNLLTPTAEWQLVKANQLTLSSQEVKRRIAQKLKISEKAVKELYTDAVRTAHAEWQGQIYSLVKGHPKYPYFYDATGYGTGDGLCGWNCRHSFFPYFEGLSSPANEPNFSLAENAQVYADTQKQRGYERAIRKSKRELAALDGARSAESDPAAKAKYDGEFARKSAVLKRQEARLSEHLKATGLLPDNSRVRVDGFGRSVSQKAVHANKKYLLDKAAKSDIMKAEQQSDLGLLKQKLRSDDRVSKEYYAAVRGKFSRGSDAAKKAFSKFVPQDSVANAAFEGTAYYDTKSKKIYMHYNADMNNPRGNTVTWFHEHGHLIDDMAKNISHSSEYESLLRSDYRSYMAAYGKVNNLKTFDKVQAAISKDLNSMRKHSAVSDILEGLSDGNIHGVAGHGPEYWKKNSDAISSEAFAHMYEAQFDKTRYAEMQKYFPNALKYFEDKLEEAVK